VIARVVYLSVRSIRVGVERTRLAMTVVIACMVASSSIALGDASSISVSQDTVTISTGESELAETLPLNQLPRVLSINLCADQLVMLLADDDQIAALSTLSRDSAGSYFHERAASFAQADKRAEDILPRGPDVVLTGPYTSRYTLSLLEELDLRVESLMIADSFESMLGNIETVGAVVHQKERADELVQSLRLKMAAIKRRVKQFDDSISADGQSAPRAAVYDPNGYTVGHRTVRGEAMSIAGWHNIALDKGIENYGVLKLEDLIKLAPQALVESPYSKDTYSRGQAVTGHPALRQAGLNPLIISLPSNQTICAGPWIIDVIEQLFTARELL
jgi:iron complex transport system substrate-binding protein